MTNYKMAWSIEDVDYKEIELEWSKPILWNKDDSSWPVSEKESVVYVFIKDHGKQKDKIRIRYVGITGKAKTRSYNHPTAQKILKEKGKLLVSWAEIKVKNKQDVRQQVEHLLIWTLGWEYNLENKKNQQIMPGLGKNGPYLLKITNKGYRFHGKMPLEIVFPTMAVKPGHVHVKKK